MTITPPTQPEFIAITGPNGSGKSTFIQNNKSFLENFIIIQPDFNLNHAKDLERAISQGKKVILETPWNSNNLIHLVDEVINRGYNTSLYQLYFNSATASWRRVDSRNKTPYNIKLDIGNVNRNFNENFKNVSEYFFYFNDIYFIDAKDYSLAATFKGSILTMLSKIDSIFIHKFADWSNSHQRMSAETFENIKAKLPFQNEMFKESILNFKK